MMLLRDWWFKNKTYICIWKLSIDEKYLFIISFLLLILPIKAQLPLSEESRISILTSYPSDEEVFTLYGHTAIRILDPAQNIDLVFNYGIFDFHTPNFIYRFAKGETDYKLGVDNFQNYFIEYQMRGSKVVEQALNLNQVEKKNYGKHWLSTTSHKTERIAIISFW